MTDLNRIGEAARSAAFALSTASTAEKNRALAAIADALVENCPAILQANALDVEAGRQAGLTASLIDRLSLTEARVGAMAEGVRDVMRLPDPVGRVLSGSTLDCGLE
ncbi:MAG: gamma-glutamyl-phosphate reductase, partial [Clostridiales bacterium]|nr:gamma-glutamyl-phosphate reductase [Clostridiales bacterium]